MDKQKNIIDFTSYIRGKQMSATKEKEVTLFKELIEELKTSYGKEYTNEEVDSIAKRILLEFGIDSEDCATPIVKIAKAFGFKTYRKTLDDGKSGDISINGETKERYGYEKVIFVQKEDELYQQRFVVAHELAHYLFDYLGNPEYENGLLFTDTYMKDHHDSEHEQRANRFAAAILMPEEVFIKQYNIAQEYQNRLFTRMYLSEFFETRQDSIDRRIVEVFS